VALGLALRASRSYRLSPFLMMGFWNRVLRTICQPAPCENILLIMKAKPLSYEREWYFVFWIVHLLGRVYYLSHKNILEKALGLIVLEPNPCSVIYLVCALFFFFFWALGFELRA
jgi:hypothetical protein